MLGVGASVVRSEGACVGTCVGAEDGPIVGFNVDPIDGTCVGVIVGTVVDECDTGAAVGTFVAAAVGEAVSVHFPSIIPEQTRPAAQLVVIPHGSCSLAGRAWW